jgi:hypothetical protein
VPATKSSKENARTVAVRDFFSIQDLCLSIAYDTAARSNSFGTPTSCKGRHRSPFTGLPSNAVLCSALETGFGADEADPMLEWRVSGVGSVSLQVERGGHLIGISTSPTKSKNRFFVLMAVTVAATVFIGFAPTFYLRSTFNPGIALSVLLHVHGFVLSAWIILFLVQTVLIARGSRALHQRLGWFLAGLAVAVVVLMCAAIVEQLRRVPPLPPPAFALAFGGFDIIVFAILVSSAIYLRRRPDWHKRLMISATILLVGAALVRVLVLLGVRDLQKIMFLEPLLTDLLLVPCFIYDFLTRRKIHPAYFVALGLILTDQVVQPIVLSWPAWTTFANALQRLVA